MLQPVITTVSDLQELEGIKQLQKKNLRIHLTEAEALSQGFLTAEYSLDLLRDMHQEAPSIIAKDNDNVVGYALATTRACAGGHPLLDDLFRQIDRITWQNRLLSQENYIVVGQLCVQKEYAGRALAKMMYDFFRECYSSKYAYLITDIAMENTRSLKAHLKTGFQVIDTLQYGGMGWNVVLWNWNHKS